MKKKTSKKKTLECIVKKLDLNSHGDVIDNFANCGLIGFFSSAIALTPHIFKVSNLIGAFGILYQVSKPAFLKTYTKKNKITREIQDVVISMGDIGYDLALGATMIDGLYCASEFVNTFDLSFLVGTFASSVVVLVSSFGKGYNLVKKEYKPLFLTLINHPSTDMNSSYLAISYFNLICTYRTIPTFTFGIHFEPQLNDAAVKTLFTPVFFNKLSKSESLISDIRFITRKKDVLNYFASGGEASDFFDFMNCYRCDFKYHEFIDATFSDCHATVKPFFFDYYEKLNLEQFSDFIKLPGVNKLFEKNISTILLDYLTMNELGYSKFNDLFLSNKTDFEDNLKYVVNMISQSNLTTFFKFSLHRNISNILDLRIKEENVGIRLDSSYINQLYSRLNRPKKGDEKKYFILHLNEHQLKDKASLDIFLDDYECNMDLISNVKSLGVGDDFNLDNLENNLKYFISIKPELIKLVKKNNALESFNMSGDKKYMFNLELLYDKLTELQFSRLRPILNTKSYNVELAELFTFLDSELISDIIRNTKSLQYLEILMESDSIDFLSDQLSKQNDVGNYIKYRAVKLYNSKIQTQIRKTLDSNMSDLTSLFLLVKDTVSSDNDDVLRLQKLATHKNLKFYSTGDIIESVAQLCLGNNPNLCDVVFDLMDEGIPKSKLVVVLESYSSDNDLNAISLEDFLDNSKDKDNLSYATATYDQLLEEETHDALLEIEDRYIKGELSKSLMKIAINSLYQNNKPLDVYLFELDTEMDIRSKLKRDFKDDYEKALFVRHKIKRTLRKYIVSGHLHRNYLHKCVPQTLVHIAKHIVEKMLKTQEIIVYEGDQLQLNNKHPCNQKILGYW